MQAHRGSWRRSRSWLSLDWWSSCRSASTHTVDRSAALSDYVPFIGDDGIVKSVNELLWERFGYGPAAIEMIKEHPIDGIGVGTFHALVIDYGRLSAIHPRSI